MLVVTSLDWKRVQSLPQQCSMDDPIGRAKASGGNRRVVRGDYYPEKPTPRKADKANRLLVNLRFLI